MDWDLTEDQRLVRDMVREFVAAEVVPEATAWDHEKSFPQEVFAQLGELGLFGMTIAEDNGGAGLDLTTYCLVLEELGYGDASTCVAISVTNSVYCAPLQRYGSEAQKERFLRPCAGGEWLGAFCLSEPEVGSDAAALKVRAERDGDDYIINGTKAWVTNGSVAGALLVFAVTDPTARRGRMSAFVVPSEHAGVTMVHEEDKMGIRSSRTNQVAFDDCRVPADWRLGEEGQGLEIALASLDGGRAGIAAQSVGIARAALDLALQYVREREAFGGPIGRFEGLQAQLVTMAAQIRAGRLLYLRAATLRDAGERDTAAAAMAKLYASEMCNRVAYQAVQMHGGYGYVRDYPVERLYRDARVTTIYEGTSEIQRLVIARQMLAS
ncbi:MAG: acyl-CoA dehydrogenase family protein [Acidobacteriota bacterium]|jgi:alkylation response protein AidB-like acyl-CoA dehydrogenase